MRTTTHTYDRRLPVFFLLTFTISWGCWWPAALGVQLPLNAMLVDLLGAWGPSLSAILIVMYYDRLAGLRRLLTGLGHWRIALGGYLFILLWPLALSLLTTLIGVSILGLAAPNFGHPSVLSLYPVPTEVSAAGLWVVLPMVLITQTLGSSLGEEVGWRGFAQSRLQGRMNPLAAALLVGVVWGLWHLPRYLSGEAGLPMGEFTIFVLGIAVDAIVYAWVWNRSGRSLLLVVLFHTSQVMSSLFISDLSLPRVKIALTLMLVAWIVWHEGTELGAGTPSHADRPD